MAFQGRRFGQIVRMRLESDKDLGMIAASEAVNGNCRFVALGSPKQEKWIAANGESCAANRSIGVGISFSFIAAQVRCAPRRMRAIDLEWLHRIVQDPARLAKRFLVDDLSLAPYGASGDAET